MMLRMSFTSIFHIKEPSDISIDILVKLGMKDSLETAEIILLEAKHLTKT